MYFINQLEKNYSGRNYTFLRNAKERRREYVFSRLASLSTENGELARQAKKYIYLNNGNKLYKADCFLEK